MTGNRTTKPGGWIWLGLLLLAAGILRFYKLNSPLWLDEVVALVQSYREPFWQILTSFPGHFPHPLYGQLAHGSLSVFGESAFSIRLPAALFGIAGIFYFYRFSRRFSGHGEALLGAALLTVSYHHIYFSQDARGYTVYLLLALIATGLFTRAAAFIASGQMAVAYFWMHQPRSLWPIGDPPEGNSGSLAILFCFAFFLLVFTGGGSYSIDAQRKRHR